MYKSPIEIIYGQTQAQIEGDILRAVQSYAINVDKAELLRSLQYDREQYNKGYVDGTNDAMASIVRCKDCKHYKPRNQSAHWEQKALCCTRSAWSTFPPDGFCSFGERREE